MDNTTSTVAQPQQQSKVIILNDADGNPRWYDFGTKNESFLLTCKELKELGVKCWYFPLEIKYPNLGVQNIDPYDPKLSPEDIGKVLVECKNNPWYFFREVTRVPVRGAGLTQLYLHRAGCASIWSFLHNIDFELVQPRQTYKTTVLTAIMSYMMLFEYRNCDIPYLHKKESRCTDNIGILRDYITSLPKYLNPWANQKHLPGLQSLKYEGKHNVSIKPLAAPKSESVATDVTRGFSLFTWFADECEFIPYMKAIIDGANPTIVQARETAEKNGIHHCMMYASTPGDLETNEGKEWEKILNNLPRFKEDMYDRTTAELNRLKHPPAGSMEAPLTMIYIEFNHVQLRKDGEWLRQQYFEAVQKSTLGEYRRGVLLQRFRGGEGSFFKQEDLDYIQSKMREPDYDVCLMKKYHLYVYKHNIQVPDLNSQAPYFDMIIPYLIGIDCATGKDGDNTAICIVHPYTLEVVAELVSPYMGGLDLMRIVTILAKMLPKALFCLESNMTGVDIIDFVQESQLENRFYHDPRATEMTKNVTEPQNSVISMKARARAKRHFGTYVSPKVRKTMFNVLRDTLHDYRHLIYTKFLVKDICNLVEQKNGNMAAAAGEHDDMVMAYLHTLYVLKYGYELGRFGINKSLCTYEKASEIMQQYNQALLEDLVDNTPSAEMIAAGSHEAQMYYDMMGASSTFVDENGYDEYGHKHDEYKAYGNLQNRQEVLQSTHQSLAFFRDINKFSI